MAEIIKLHDADMCVECPECGSQLFYAILEDDLVSLARLECGGFDVNGDECDYALTFDVDEDAIEFTFDADDNDDL